MSRDFFVVWSALITCILAPILAGFLNQRLEFLLINSRELERMYAEDGVTLAAAQARYFSGMTAGITAVLTPIILTPCLALAFLLTIGRASHRAVAIFFVLAIPTFVGLNLISGAVSNQQTGGIAWGSAMLSGPLVYSIMLLVREKRTGSRA